MNSSQPVSKRRIFRRLARNVRMFLFSEVAPKAWFLVGALAVLMLCINGMNVANSYVGRYFMSAIEAHSRDGFLKYAWAYIIVFALSTLIGVLMRFSEERLVLLWRDWLTRRSIQFYLGRRMYLSLEESAEVTNPDQRMAEDIRSLTTSTVSFVLMIVNGTVTAISFSGVMWSISPKLFVIAVLYAAFGSAATFLLGKPLIRLNYQQSDREADFRAGLIHVRENAEGIALTRAEGRTRERLLGRLDALVVNFRRIVAVNRNLGFFTSGYNYMIQLIPALVVAPLFIDGQVEFGVIGQSAMAFATLLGAFSLVVTQFQSISSYASVVARLSEFVEAMEREHARDDEEVIARAEPCHCVEYTHLTIKSADEQDRVLLRDLSVRIEPGTPTLVRGTGEAAKEMLFRASAGLRAGPSTGKIRRPPPGSIAFLSEQPYLPPGTLREVLVPPQREEELSDDDVLAVAREVKLEPVIAKHQGLHASRHWDDVLSFTEKHLVAVARVLLAKPSFAFLDRLDSALEETEHRRVLRLLADRGITCISINSCQPDPELHAACLSLADDGSWQWTKTAA
jgi:putative ATP-binding cassette transporter